VALGTGIVVELVVMNVIFIVVPVEDVVTVWTELSSSVFLRQVALTQNSPVWHTSTTVGLGVLTHFEPSGECWQVGFSSKRITRLLLQSRWLFGPPQSAVVVHEPLMVVDVVGAEVVVVTFFTVVDVMVVDAIVDVVVEVVVTDSVVVVVVEGDDVVVV
jgi:hypothetical protein